MATPLLIFLYFVIVIVVADVLTIYSVYNSNVLYKRQRRFYKGLLQKIKQKSTLILKKQNKKRQGSSS